MKTHNTLVAEMQALIQARKAPRGARAPRPIERERLFALDVDDTIWEDESDEGDKIAPWQSDENVRRGICLLLQLDRCIEEEILLKRERRAMQEWYIEELSSTKSAITAASKSSLIVQNHRILIAV